MSTYDLENYYWWQYSLDRMWQWAFYLPTDEICICKPNREDFVRPCPVHSVEERSRIAVRKGLEKLCKPKKDEKKIST